MFILQDLARILQKNGYLSRSCKMMIIFQDFCKTDGYLARFLQDEWLSCTILARRMVILQDFCKTNGYLARFLQDGWLSCKILQDFGRKSFKTMYRLARFYT